MAIKRSFENRKLQDHDLNSKFKSVKIKRSLNLRTFLVNRPFLKEFQTLCPFFLVQFSIKSIFMK